MFAQFRCLAFYLRHFINTGNDCCLYVNVYQGLKIIGLERPLFNSERQDVAATWYLNFWVFRGRYNQGV